MSNWFWKPCYMYLLPFYHVYCIMHYHGDQKLIFNNDWQWQRYVVCTQNMDHYHNEPLCIILFPYFFMQCHMKVASQYAAQGTNYRWWCFYYFEQVSGMPHLNKNSTQYIHVHMSLRLNQNGPLQGWGQITDNVCMYIAMKLCTESIFIFQAL